MFKEETISLQDRANQLVDAFTTLHWVIVEDKPGVVEGSALLDLLAAGAEDAAELVAAIQAIVAQHNSAQPDQAGELLLKGQAFFNKLLFHFYGELRSPDRLEALSYLSKLYPAQWSVWAENVLVSLTACAEILFFLSEALLVEWQMLVNCWNNSDLRTGRLVMTLDR